MTGLTFRSATVVDADVLVEIYNHYVRTSSVTFDLDPWSTDDMAHKIEAVAELGMPFLVAELAGELVGYAYLSMWREKRAYQTTMENTLYVRNDVRGKGYGRLLLDAVVQDGVEVGVREVVAVIANTPDAVPSIRLHEKAGFVSVGAMDRVGRKFDEWIGVVMMQKSLSRD